tara:strand:+ start:4562 stop:4840 length:279 start_codon:yes stop_codon:yes gene_type:complete
MKRYLLTGLIILSLGASACYRDNYVVQTSSISGQELRIEWKYKGDLMTSSINIPYLSETYSEADAVCIASIEVGAKLPDCILPAVKWFAYIR